jgi:P-type conjugative transfer protein TrbJ
MNATSRVKAKLLSVFFAAFFAVVSGITALAPRSAFAQVVICSNCSDIVTQLAGYGEQLLQYAKQVQQYEMQIQQYQNMLKNTTQIPQQMFDNALSTVRNVEGVMNSTTNIRYMMGDLDNQFRSYYPDVYQQMTSLQGISPQQVLLQDYARSRQAYDSALSALKAAQMQSSDLQNDQFRMDFAGSSLVGANGHLDAIQAAGEYAQMTAQQLMKMRQLAMVQIQVQSTVVANEQRRDDSYRAAFENWVANRPPEASWTTGHTSDDTP